MLVDSAAFGVAVVAMSFFGLTSLGDQAPFASNTKGGTNIGLFDEHDVSTAFDRAAKGPTLGRSQIALFFDKLYHGPRFPDLELRTAERVFLGEAMGKEAFVAIVVQSVRDSCCAGPQRELAAEFNSNLKLRECANKNLRRTTGPSEAFDTVRRWQAPAAPALGSLCNPRPTIREKCVLV